MVLIGHVVEVNLMGYDKNLIVHKENQRVKKCSTKLGVKKDKT